MSVNIGDLLYIDLTTNHYHVERYSRSEYIIRTPHGDVVVEPSGVYLCTDTYDDYQCDYLVSICSSCLLLVEDIIERHKRRASDRHNVRRYNKKRSLEGR